MKTYKHWSEFPMENWHWPSFTPREMACRGTGKLAIDPPSMDLLQALRNKLGRPLIVNSAYRSVEHNRAVGGARFSEHLKARAYDVRMENHDPIVFMSAALDVGFTGIGQYADKGFTHVDNRGYRANFGTKKWPTTRLKGVALDVTESPVPSKGRAAVAQTAGTGGVIIAAKGALNDVAPALDPQIVTYIAAGLALVSLGFIVYRYLRREDD